MKVTSAVSSLLFVGLVGTTEALSSFSQIGANVQGTAGTPDRVLPPNSNSPEPKKGKKTDGAAVSIAPTLTGGLVGDAAGRRRASDELPPNSQPKAEFFYPSKTTGATKSYSTVKESKPNAKNIGFFFPPPKK
jgi:hypothetical protein